LEYDRALYLVQNKGYSVFAAKKQAAQEIMTAFEFATAVTYSEDFAIFQNDGVGSGTIAGNGTLLAISALVMGNRSDDEIQSVVDKFREDIKTDGEWNDLQTKADMADWASGFKYDNIRASVKSWNILDIPDYETYLDVYWNNVYGLGGCSINRKDVVAPNSNKLSKYYGSYFTCKLNGAKYSWQAATTYEKDTYGWSKGKSGEFKKGDVTDSIYIFNGTKWEFSEIETAIGLCQKNNAGVVSVFNNIHYICRDNAWEKATMLEFDTYGLTGVEGDVKVGVVNKNKYYVYKDGKWQSATSIEKDLGGCVASREGEVGKSGDFYYTCKSKTWASATSIEKDLGGCVASREGEVSKSGEYYYICKSKTWAEATVLEYDTYGKTCLTDGSIVDGEVDHLNKYVCDAGFFRMAKNLEKSLNKGCVSYTEGNKIRKEETSTLYSLYLCKNGLWENLEGIFEDSRDGKIYKTVLIGKQIWMGQNLNYKAANSYCYSDDTSFCSKYGRLYTWAAVMDSVGKWKTNGKGCGYGKTCSPTYPVRGICPTGWHLPTKDEFNTLFLSTRADLDGGVLKSTSGWNDYKGQSGNGADAYSFSALPAGAKSDLYFYNEGSSTSFWSSTEKSPNMTYDMNLKNSGVGASLGAGSKDFGYSVRCVKD
jgi:uncharacterized protein (TIGR02145 family)